MMWRKTGVFGPGGTGELRAEMNLAPGVYVGFFVAEGAPCDIWKLEDTAHAAHDAYKGAKGNIVTIPKAELEALIARADKAEAALAQVADLNARLKNQSEYLTHAFAERDGATKRAAEAERNHKRTHDAYVSMNHAYNRIHAELAETRASADMLRADLNATTEEREGLKAAIAALESTTTPWSYSGAIIRAEKAEAELAKLKVDRQKSTYWGAIEGEAKAKAEAARLTDQLDYCYLLATQDGPFEFDPERESRVVAMVARLRKERGVLSAKLAAVEEAFYPFGCKVVIS